MLADGSFPRGVQPDQQLEGVNRFILKYGDQGVDLADACIARMSELFPSAKIYSVDGKHFQLMRRFGNEPLPVTLLAR